MGPKFFCCSKMAITRRRSKLWWRKAHQSKALVELQRSRRSKRDLKPSGTYLFICLAPAGILRELCYKKQEIIVEKMSKNQFWPVLKYVKKYAELDGDIRFGWNLLKWWVFNDFHFWHFLYFCICLDFGVGGMRL